MSASATFRHDNPGVIAPPPLIFASALILGIAIDRFVAGGASHAPAAFRYAIASSLGFAAAIVLVGALGLFRLAGTRPEPWKPTTAIVTGGVYRITRNPMYAGMALAYASVTVLVGGLVTLALLPAALAAVHYGVILREERYLEAKFGAEYLRYKSRVRRWI